jgi:hypothetical protein
MVLLAILSCKKNETFKTSQATFSFSKDTVFFDTVFTRLPGSPYPRSINKRIMIRNPYKESVKFNARVMGGSSSEYRFNIDGRYGLDIKDIEVLPKDSLRVFVECTLEPNQLTKPALVRDSIAIENNGKTQFIQLAAYGWDAYYYKDTVFTQNTSITQTDKPHVIVNAAYVEEGITLSIGPGVHFYSTANSVFINNLNRIINVSALNVFGTLKVNGTKAQPVIFEGDRLDVNFKDKPGQWRGIHFYRGSIDNEIRFAEIKNATIGLWADSLSENSNPTLIVRNSIIKNMSAYGVLGLTADIYMENSVIANCGSNTLLGYYGGYYTLRHCTLYAGGGRRDPHLVFNNQLRNDNRVVIRTYPIGFAILNTIIGGVNETEIGFDLSAPNVASPAALIGCLIKSKNTINGQNLLFNLDPSFENIGKLDFKLKEGSAAINKADLTYGLPIDINEKVRDAQPDIGAYEF